MRVKLFIGAMVLGTTIAVPADAACRYASEENFVQSISGGIFRAHEVIGDTSSVFIGRVKTSTNASEVNKVGMVVTRQGTPPGFYLLRNSASSNMTGGLTEDVHICAGTAETDFGQTFTVRRGGAVPYTTIGRNWELYELPYNGHTLVVSLVQEFEYFQGGVGADFVVGDFNDLSEWVLYYRGTFMGWGGEDNLWYGRTCVGGTDGNGSQDACFCANMMQCEIDECGSCG